MRHNSILTTDEDQELYNNAIRVVLRPHQWENKIRRENPILEKYFAREQFDRYVTTAALLGLSYREYATARQGASFCAGYYYAPHVAVPPPDRSIVLNQ
tara:strand:- start:913 stop:1209 length:297 start_codon:yes stop_codon:yes gene_type:complete